MQWQGGQQRVMVLPPGEYQVTMQPVYGASERVVWPQKVRIEPGQQVTFKLQSGVLLPYTPLFRSIWRWSAVEPGNPSRVIQWQNGQHPLMALPPGEYQVTMQPVYGASERVVWPQKVRIEAG